MKQRRYTVGKEDKETSRQFVYDENGATASEYAIIASLIAAVIVLVVSQVGLMVKNLFALVINGW